MARRNVQGALRIISDNMDAVHRNIDSLFSVNLPKEQSRAIYADIFTRFRLQKEVTRRFCPEKLPIVSKLENLTRKHKSGKISDFNMFKEVKRISLRNGLDQNFVEYVGQRLATSKANIPGFGSPMSFQPFKIQPFATNTRKRPKKMRKHSSARNAINYLFGGKR